MPKKSSSKAKLKTVDNNLNNQQEEQPVSQKRTVFVTSDGMGHYDQNYATDHSRRLDDETITATTEDEWTGPITEQVASDGVESIAKFEKAEDMVVPSAAQKYQDA